MIENKRKHFNGANSLFQVTNEAEPAGDTEEFSKVLQLLREKVKRTALTTVPTLLGSSLQLMTRINGFFGQSRAGQMHLDVHLSMSRCLEEFADG